MPGDTEGALHIAPALVAREANLARGSPCALQDERVPGNACQPVQLPRQDRRLIETSLEKAPAVERHWDDEIGLLQQLSSRLSKPAPEKAAGDVVVAILELVHEIPQDAIEMGDGAGPVVVRRACDRLGGYRRPANVER